MAGTRGAPGRLAGAGRRAAAVLVGLVLALGLVEGAARIVGAVAGRPWDAEAARERVRSLRARLDNADWRTLPAGGPALHPYVGAQDSAVQSWFAEHARLTREADRSDYFELGVVGGSVSVMLVRDAGERLAGALGRDSRVGGRRVRVHALGEFGHKQPQQLTMVGWALALGWHLDALVNVDGFNEVTVANQNATDGGHPLYPYFAVWSHVAASGGTEESEDYRHAMRLARDDVAESADRLLAGPWLFSAVTGPFAARSIERRVEWHEELQAGYVGALAVAASGSVAMVGPEHARDLEAVLDSAVHAWVECSISLAGLCERQGVSYLHVLQPTLHDPESGRTSTAEERRDGGMIPSWTAAVTAGYPRLRAAAPRLAAADVPFFDATRIFAGETERVYSDACHLVPAASGVFADAIATELAARLR